MKWICERSSLVSVESRLTKNVFHTADIDSQHLQKTIHTIKFTEKQAWKTINAIHVYFKQQVMTLLQIHRGLDPLGHRGLTHTDSEMTFNLW